MNTKTSLNIALIGYGRMGKEIEKIALQRGHKIGLKIGSSNLNDFNASNLQSIDVAIEFSIPESAYGNLLTLANNKVPTICGTTAWLDKYNDIAERFNKQESAFLYASNFSLAVNLFFMLNKKLAKLMSPYKAYDVRLKEFHHINKKDAPSGTAVTIAEDILGLFPYKTGWELESKNSDLISIQSIREGDIKGIHEVSYESENDLISIRHEAKSRLGFAHGALIAAEWLHDKTGIFGMEDVLGLH